MIASLKVMLPKPLNVSRETYQTLRNKMVALISQPALTSQSQTFVSRETNLAKAQPLNP